MRPFRFGLQTSSAPDGKAWRDKARKAEELGYAALYIPDHFGDQWGPLVALTVAAEATSTIQIGGLVFDNDYRHPVVLAKELATLDLVSEGRLIFGLGAGWMRSDYEQSGIAYDEPAVRVDRFEEAVAVYKELFGEGTATYDGTHYTIAGAEGEPRPHSGGPTLLIGGGGKRVLTIAANEADIVGVNPNLKSGATDEATARSAVADMVDKRIGWIKDAAGDRFDDLDLQMLTFIVSIGGDRDEMAKLMAPSMGLTEEQAREAPLALVGSVEEICDQLVERRERWGLNDWVVHDPEFEAFAEVVDRLAGT